MSNFIDWPGKSGNLYRYVILDLTKPINAVAVNYAFVQQLPNGRFRPLYFGETGNAQTRINSSHEQWDAAIKAGATHVIAHTTQGGEKVRCAEEKDLIEQWQPSLNVQHRQAK